MIGATIIKREGHIPSEFQFTVETSSTGMWPDLSLSLLTEKPILSVEHKAAIAKIASIGKRSEAYE